ncbi:MAG TPA: tRNA (guanosine(37)-N1)-methyltransferase TrmD [Thermoanaerobaculia bacterium]|nr:tRNA (guanosine(37)-N1)-methyltransferase TrmD [Thermoanaerobaculia bacterium]
MRFDIVTLFPGFFASPFDESLVGRAVEAGLLDLRVVDLRDFSDDAHRKVDDEPYGGGPGMVLTAPPVFAAVEALRAEAGAPAPHVVFLSPQGRRFDAALAKELAARPRVALVCGRYEGIDERTRDAGLFDEEISLGDFVLSGGEVAALAVVEAVSRYVPGVVGDAGSVRADSFEDGLLDHPHYSRPREFRGLAVPDVLFSGHHERIRRWRREQQLEATWRRRPDLLEKAPLSAEERAYLERLAARPRST